VNDDRLRDAFAELRRVEAERAPQFERLWYVDPARSRLRVGPFPRLALAALLLLVVVLALVPMLRRPPQPSITAWKAPTDFLLATPGRELLHSTPELRGSHQ
jgi:hypothetical protein